jgi:hypothetical protein
MRRTGDSDPGLLGELSDLPGSGNSYELAGRPSGIAPGLGRATAEARQPRLIGITLGRDYRSLAVADRGALLRHIPPGPSTPLRHRSAPILVQYQVSHLTAVPEGNTSIQRRTCDPGAASLPAGGN